MEKRISSFVSYVLHPLLMPTYLLIFFLNSPALVYYRYSAQLKWMLTGYVFLLTFFVPAMMMLIMKKNKLILSFKMESRQERIFPLVFMSIIYYLTFYFLRDLGILNIYSYFLLGVTLTTLITLTVNFWTKVSLHMIGMGGFTGVLLALALRAPDISLVWIYAIFVASGLVATSRYVLSDHTVRQLFYGYLLGFGVMFFLMVWVV